jgi:hypothetical protein
MSRPVRVKWVLYRLGWCGTAAVLTSFIDGLLYLLCFEHIDNLGAYRIPAETGLLISTSLTTSDVSRNFAC